MNLALKHRLQRSLTRGVQQVRLSWDELAQQTGVAVEQIDELVNQAATFYLLLIAFFPFFLVGCEGLFPEPLVFGCLLSSLFSV